MQTLKFLGRGSAFNIKEGNTSAYFIYKERLFLIDCGENIFERIINNDLLKNIKQVQVFITHLNSDHVGSLSSLIYYCYYIKKIPVQVNYPSPELRQLLELNGNKEECDYLLCDEANFDDGYVNFTYSKVPHIKGIKCYSLLINIYGKTIYYSGDSNNIPLGIIESMNLIDEIYQDTCLADYDGNVHLSLRKLCELIPKEYRHKVYCMHIDSPELIEKAKTEGFNIVEIERSMV